MRVVLLGAGLRLSPHGIIPLQPRGSSLATIGPFFGVRYDPGVVGALASVICPPYDVISSAAQRDLYDRSPYNVVRLEFGREVASDTPSNNRYSRAAADYRSWRGSGALRADPVPSFYLYDEVFLQDGSGVTRRSLVAPVRLARWEENVVLPHEHTLPKPKADRLQLLRATHTQFSPLLSVYDDPGEVGDILAQVAASLPAIDVDVPEGSLAAAAATHRLWQIADARTIARLVAAWEPLRLYIADGHHRYETALAYRDEQREAGAAPGGPADYVLMALVEANDPGLVVLPTHRIVRGLGVLDPGQILTKLRATFDVADSREVDFDPSTPTASARLSFTMVGLIPGVAHRLTVRADVDLNRLLLDVPPVLRELDTLVLQRLVLERVLGLARDEAEAGERIQYTRDPQEALRIAASGEAQLVVFLAPTPLGKLRDAMRAGARMPQKTTYFFPKPVTGLVFFDHDAAWS
jgi:uncharacterized protein (DUF1015 family)